MSPPSPTEAFTSQCPALPENGQWRIEMRSRDIGGIGPLRYGHTYIAVVDPTGKSALEFHGFNKDPVTGESKHGAGEKGDLLGVAMVPGAWGYFSERPAAGGTLLAEGSADDIREKVTALTATAQAINAEKLAYKGYGVLESGQNCNSVAHTLARAIGYDKDPQATADVILTGSDRILPTPELDAARTPDGSVDPKQAPQAMSLYVAEKGADPIVLPDPAQMFNRLNETRCQTLDLEEGIRVEGLVLGSPDATTSTITLAQPREQPIPPPPPRKNTAALGF